MPHETDALTATALIAFAAQKLAENGYRVVRESTDESWLPEHGLLAEDSYSVVVVAAFDSWPDVLGTWEDLQASLVDLLGRRLARSAPKAWDGYLVLLCLGEPLQKAEINEIERDTTRIRKIVATGQMLQVSADVASALDVLMPLDPPTDNVEVEDVLSLLPDMLSSLVEPAAVRVVIDAFEAMEPPLERLHTLLEAK